MIKKIFTISVAFAISLNISLSQQNFNTGIYERIAQHEKQAALKRTGQPGHKTGSGYNVVYHRCWWEINPAVYYIKGSVCTYFVPNADINSLDFDLAHSLTVDSVKYHGQVISHSHPSEVLYITLPQTANSGIKDSITIYYQGEPSGGGFGSFTQMNHGSSSTPVIWTLSEPYGASDWWPCKETLDDKIDSIDVYVVSPVPYHTASNGLLVSKTSDGNLITCHWKHRYPIANYLVAIAVTNYAVFTDKAKISPTDSITIYNYVYPEDSSVIRPVAALVKQPMQFFSEKFIPYPFSAEKYGHTQFGWGGGMEHQTMTFLGVFNYSIMAHELAHQWFGDYITCGSWQDIWLNEGFATYLDALTLEAFFPTDFPTWKSQVIQYVTSLPGGSIFCYDTSDVDQIFNYRLSYLKSAFVLHMLRMQIGDNAFFTALQNYLTDPAIANGFATTPQLKAHLETVSETDLTEFFNDWVYGEGYPVFAVNYYFYHENRLAINILQHPSITAAGIFELPLELKIDGKNKDTLLNINIVSDNQLLFFDDLGIDSINTIVVDPYKNILTKGAVVTSLQKAPEIRSIIVYPNPAGDKIHFGFPAEIRPQQMMIYDFSGKMLYKSNLLAVSDIITTDIGLLPSGIYFARFQTANGYEMVKFEKK